LNNWTISKNFGHDLLKDKNRKENFETSESFTSLRVNSQF